MPKALGAKLLEWHGPPNSLAGSVVMRYKRWTIGVLF